jgi:aryl-alcohol dehydrogenase-like predicted oxidoreductase
MTMKYYLLGKTGLKVSELCLGAMTFGQEWGWGASKDECRKMFNAYVQAGGNFIDTANKYTEGTSEKYIGEFIAPDRNRFVLATKYTSNTRRGDPNAGGNHRKSMVQSLESSLERLNTDFIDLYWVHAWDHTTPIEETIRVLDDMVKEGKILYAGISDAPAWIVSQANTLANLKGWTEFTAIQIEYSLIERTPERELLPMAGALDIGITAWSPLGNGILTGKYNKNKGQLQQQQPQQEQQEHHHPRNGSSTSSSAAPESSSAAVAAEVVEGSSRLNMLKSMSPDMINSLLSDRNIIIAEQVSRIANEIGCSAAQVALNWIRQQRQQRPRQPIIPIIGSRKESQIKDNLACLESELSDEQLRRLNEISKIELGFPHDFLKSEMIRDIIYGGTYSSIYNHREQEL